MRTRPYNFGNTNTSPPAAQPGELKRSSFEESIVLNLKDEFKRPPAKQAPQPEPTGIKEPALPTQDVEEDEVEVVEAESENEPKEPAPAPGSAKMRESVDKLKGTIEKEIAKTLENPQRASKNVLKFLNFVRMYAYPWIYKKILFEAAEQKMFDPLMEKVTAAKMKNEEPKLNNAEKELWAKIEFYQKEKLLVKWSEQEIEDINEVAYLKLAEIKVLRWLMENEWMLVIIVIEFKRFGPIIGKRMGLPFDF